jgi:hypothetical protein
MSAGGGRRFFQQKTAAIIRCFIPISMVCWWETIRHPRSQGKITCSSVPKYLKFDFFDIILITRRIKKLFIILTKV